MPEPPLIPDAVFGSGHVYVFSIAVAKWMMKQTDVFDLVECGLADCHVVSMLPDVLQHPHGGDS
ncbi:MAG: hypothetical protein R3B95_07795 [Nitrospirales bacterium]|nr:hypothetical protein [Nitrospirales bacterium]